MTPDFIVTFLREAVFLILILSAPVLLISLITGLIVSLLQAITQIHESTLTFVPKMAVTFIVLIITLPWMAQKMLKFTITVFANLSSYIK